MAIALHFSPSHFLGILEVLEVALGINVICVRVYEYGVVVEVAETEGGDLDKDSYNILYPLSHQFSEHYIF